MLHIHTDPGSYDIFRTLLGKSWGCRAGGDSRLAIYSTTAIQTLFY